MLEFKAFYNDWLDYDPLFHLKLGADPNKLLELPVRLELDFFKNLNFSPLNLKKYRIEAAQRVSDTLGNNIALCFSGGVDSQCMVQAFIEANIDFKIYTLKFNDDLNHEDVNHAKYFCKQNNIALNEIDFDVVKFLTRENYDYGIKYQSGSPHFNVHYKLFEILEQLGHTGVCCGGLAPYHQSTGYGVNISRNPFNFINYSKISGFPAQGSFLSFSPELAWALCFLTETFDYKLQYFQNNIYEELTNTRYQHKIKGYERAGFNIIPQDKKYTGFENVKDYFKTKTNDGWSFEKMFRFPLEKELKINDYKSKFLFTDEVTRNIDQIKNLLLLI